MGLLTFIVSPYLTRWEKPCLRWQHPYSRFQYSFPFYYVVERKWKLYCNIDDLAHEGVSKCFWTGCLVWKLQMVQLFATRYSCIAVLWISPTSSATITLYVASQWVFIVVSIYFVIDSVKKLLDTPSYITTVHTHRKKLKDVGYNNYYITYILTY
jgi:hypothetical protein